MTSRAWININPDHSAWRLRANSVGQVHVADDTRGLLNVETGAQIIVTKRITGDGVRVLHWHPATSVVHDITDHMLASAEAWAEKDLSTPDWAQHVADYLNTTGE